MKLSQMTTDQAADVMMLIAPELELLIDDPELNNIIKNRKTSKDKQEATKLGMKAMLKIANHLLKKQRQTTFNILAAFNQMQPEEIGGQLMIKTIAQVMEVLQDKELMSFFS